MIFLPQSLSTLSNLYIQNQFKGEFKKNIMCKIILKGYIIFKRFLKQNVKKKYHVREWENNNKGTKMQMLERL